VAGRFRGGVGLAQEVYKREGGGIMMKRGCVAALLLALATASAACASGEMAADAGAPGPGRDAAPTIDAPGAAVDAAEAAAADAGTAADAAALDAGAPDAGAVDAPVALPDAAPASADAAPPIDAAPLPDAPPPCDQVTFHYAGAASTVWVTGTFTDWATSPPGARPMSPDPGGGWSLTTLVGPGHQLYKFLIDGSIWIADPTNSQTEPDGFGGVNSVLDVCGTSDFR
jgi:AMP-activated protein kinase-like protein